MVEVQNKPPTHHLFIDEFYINLDTHIFVIDSIN